MLFRRMWKRHAILFDAVMIRFSSIWLTKISGLSWSRALPQALDWLVSRIWRGAGFGFMVGGWRRNRLISAAIGALALLRNVPIKLAKEQPKSATKTVARQFDKVWYGQKVPEAVSVDISSPHNAYRSLCSLMMARLNP